MDSNLPDNIIQHVKDSFCWTQSVVYINPDDNIIMNLAEAVGKNTRIPSNAPDQPVQYSKGSKFQLPEFIGSESKTVKESKFF